MLDHSEKFKKYGTPHTRGALKPQSFRTKNEIPKQVRDDKKEANPVAMLLNHGLMKIRLVSASLLYFSACGR
jgi:hypothetical protein